MELASALSELAGTSSQPPPTGVRCAFSEAWNASISSISLPVQRQLFSFLVNTV
ncbi:unnamed protein product [Trichogramma brassicae]|uniref:Uncharacterized protein n=1 Tax=Trichogramma brassicae TaxID=86971 RepID=A0A6H5ITC6_9HYME|nr:unnamed protein product [Trichogramma brassicae]